MNWCGGKLSVSDMKFSAILWSLGALIDESLIECESFRVCYGVLYYLVLSAALKHGRQIIMGGS